MNRSRFYSSIEEDVSNTPFPQPQQALQGNILVDSAQGTQVQHHSGPASASLGSFMNASLMRSDCPSPLTMTASLQTFTRSSDSSDSEKKKGCYDTSGGRRKWLDTRLKSAINGEKLTGRKDIIVTPKDTVFTLVSYNVLADYLVKMHPELYRGEQSA